MRKPQITRKGSKSQRPKKEYSPEVARDDSPRMSALRFHRAPGANGKPVTDETIIGQARTLIRIAANNNPPPLLDPFAGGGSIPLEAQRLGLEAHASDLNPVAVMINKAMIEIPPRFADMPPVNPRDRESHRGTETQRKKPADATWKGAAGLAADVRYYGEWMRERAFERIGHLYPKHNGETVIAWLWARTVTCPNPAVCADDAAGLVLRTLSKKKGKHGLARVPIPIRAGEYVWRFEVPEPGEAA